MPSSHSSNLFAALLGAHDSRENFGNRAIELARDEISYFDHLIKCASQRLVFDDWNRRETSNRNYPQRVLAGAFGNYQGRLIESSAIAQRDCEVGRVGKHDGRGRCLMNSADALITLAPLIADRAFDQRIAVVLFELIEKLLASHA